MKMTKLLALVLSVLMVVSVMPLSAFAAPSAVTVSDTATESEAVENEAAELASTPVTDKYVRVHSLDEIVPNQRYIIIGSYYNETTGETSYHAMGTQNYRNNGFRYSYAQDQDGTHYFDMSTDKEEITVYSYPEANHDPILRVRLRPYGYKFQGHAFYFRADNVENKGYLCGYSSSTSDGANGHHFHSSMPIYANSYNTAGDAWWYVNLPEEGENEGHWQILSRCKFKTGGTYTYEYSVMKMGVPYPNTGGQFRTSVAYPLDVGEIEDDARIQYIEETKTNIWLYREVCDHDATDVTHKEAVTPTCTSAGNPEYWYCAGCEVYFSKSDFSAKISVADTFIAPLPHDESCSHAEQAKFELYKETSMNSDQTGERYLLVGKSGDKYYAMGNVTNADGSRNAVEVPISEYGIITATSDKAEFLVYDFDENGFKDDSSYLSASDGKIIAYAPEFASSSDYIPCSIRFSQDDYETGVGAFFAYSALDTANEYIVFDEENLVFKAQSEKVNNTYRYSELCKHENMYHSEAMDATCTEQGMKEFWYCEDCYCYFADEDGLASYGDVGDMESYFLEKATGHKFGEDDVCEYCGMKRHVYTQVSTLAEFDSLSEDASYIIVFKDTDKTYAVRLPELEFACDIDSDGDGLADILEPDENENEIPDCIESYYSESYGEEYDYDNDGDFDVDDYIAFIGDHDESGDFNDADLITFLDWYHWDFHYPFEEEAKLSDNYTEVTLTDEGTITITDEGAMEFQLMQAGVWGGTPYDEENLKTDLEYDGIDPETNRIRAAWVPNYWVGTSGQIGYYEKGHIDVRERRLGDFEHPGLMDIKNWKISFRVDSTACIYSTWTTYDDTTGFQLVKFINENEEADMTMVALEEWRWEDSPIMSTRTAQLPAYLFASEPVYVGGGDEEHTCEFGDWVPNDYATHIRECTCGESETQDHIWDEGHEFQSATCSAPGLMVYTCTVETCGYEKYEEIPETDHVFGDWVPNDYATHIRECTCSESETQEHIWDEGHEFQSATCSAPGLMVYTCTVETCGYEKHEEIPVTDHVFGDWYDNGDGTHIRECEREGCDVSETEAHTYGAWVNEETYLVRTCTAYDCGASEELAINKPIVEVVANITVPANNDLGATIDFEEPVEIFNTTLTQEEQVSVAEGKATVNVYLEVIDVPVEDVPIDDKAAAEEAVADDESTQLGKYLDINLFKEVTTEEGGETSTEETKITETNDKVTITIEIPEDLINSDENVSRKYRIVRVHDDGNGNLETEIIEGTFDAEKGTFTFETDKFSTYVLAYSDNPSYVEIDLGAKAASSNVRYIEVDGIQTALEEGSDNILKFVSVGNKLIEIVEKTSDETSEIVKTQYFYVAENNASVTKLDMDSYMSAYNETSIRVKNPMGIRFKSSVLTSAKNEEIEYVIDEYGFIIATETALGEEELTFDFSKYVTGVAYNKENDTDIIFDATDDNAHIFSGYVKNIPVKEYKTNLVCKTYTKITVGGEQFILYGEPVVGNVYDTAQTLLADDTLDTETKNALYQIILDYESAIGLPGDDLYE